MKLKKTIIYLLFLLVIFSFINPNENRLRLSQPSYVECDTLYIKLYPKGRITTRYKIKVYMFDVKTNQGEFQDTNEVFKLPKCNYKDTLSLIFRDIMIKPIDMDLYAWKNIDTIYVGYEISKKKPIR